MKRIIKRAHSKGCSSKDNNVKIIVVNGTNHEQNILILDLAKKYPETKHTLGIYPLDALKLSDNEIDEEINFIIKNKDKIIAIGEVGLDLKEENLHKTLDKQKINLTKFVNLAIKLSKPVIIHSRKAELHTIQNNGTDFPGFPKPLRSPLPEQGGQQQEI